MAPGENFVPGCGHCAPCLARRGNACLEKPRFFQHVDRLTGHLPWICRSGGNCNDEASSAQLPITPPYPKFHPVPTRPVFEPRPGYSPPQALNVQLIPESGPHRHRHAMQRAAEMSPGMHGKLPTDMGDDRDGPELIPTPYPASPHKAELQEPPPPPLPGPTARSGSRKSAIPVSGSSSTPPATRRAANPLRVPNR